MSRSRIGFWATLAVAAALAGGALAGPLEDGANAYAKGDYATALADLRPLAEQGDGAAANYLGLIYFSGLGVPKNDAEALKWSIQAAKAGFPDSENNLGVIYLLGRGVRRSPTLAASWFEQAAFQGFADAQFNLAGLYERGEVTSLSTSAALDWYEEAASLGQPNAQYRLGLFLRDGDGLPQSLPRAYVWLNQAKTGFTANGDGVSAKRVEDDLVSLMSKMSPDQLAEAQAAKPGAIHRFPKYVGLICGYGPYQPDRALRNDVSGSAVISCELERDGSLSKCSTVSESAPTYGFGLQAGFMATKRAFTIAPAFVDGRPVVSPGVQISVIFPLKSCDWRHVRPPH